jgi:hypothetical protein
MALTKIGSDLTYQPPRGGKRSEETVTDDKDEPAAVG